MTGGQAFTSDTYTIKREKIPFDPKTCPIFMYTVGKIISEVKDKNGEVLGTIIHEKNWEISKKESSKDILAQVENTMAICETCKNMNIHQSTLNFGSILQENGETTLFAGIALNDDISMPVNSK